MVCFFFQAEDGIRDKLVTGVQTCALPISGRSGNIAAATTPKAAKGVAQASAKLASAQEIVSSPKQNRGAYRCSTGARRKPLAGTGKKVRAMDDLLAPSLLQSVKLVTAKRRFVRAAPRLPN